MLRIILIILTLIISQNQKILNKKESYNVYSIFVDEFGCQWFGTNNGIIRKCGQYWQAYSMPVISINVSDIKKPKAGDSGLWIGTSIGIINLKYNKDSIFDILLYDSLYTSFKTNKIVVVDFDENNTGYFLTSKGIGVFNASAWKFYSKFIDVLRNDFTSIAFKGDTVYLGTRGEGVARIFKYMDGYSGASSYISPWSLLPSDTVTCILIDHNGNQWYGTTNGLVRHSSLEAKEGWDLSFVNQLPNRKITSLAEDKSGNIWIGTMGGLVLLETNPAKIRTWDRNSGLPSDSINTIFVANDQSVWIGTNLGISHFDGSVFSNIILSPYIKFHKLNGCNVKINSNKTQN